MQNKKTIIVSVGGSLIVPEEIDWLFVKNFKRVIERYIKKKHRFVIITGGGKTARKYIAAASQISGVSSEDKDWIGIHATRMNAHFLRTIFRRHAHPIINKNPHDTEDFEKSKKSVLIASGWKPGFSTDYDATVLAKNLGIKKIINLSNIDFVCDRDPRRFKNCKKLRTVSWTDFRKLVGDRWDPGMNAPFDPVASKLAQKESIEVSIMNGKNMDNFNNFLAGKKFKGTIIC